MIDLHSHLLPGVDDGSRSVEQSVRVLQEFVLQGITDVVATPHLLASRASEGFPESYNQAWEALKPNIPNGITVHRGAEVMLDRPLMPGIESREVSLNNTRYILVEFPRVVPAEIVTRALDDVMSHGLVPVLAHPERYTSCTVAAVHNWRNQGAVMAVDATTLLQPRARGDRARALVMAGMADVLAGDNHGDDRCIAAAVDWLAEHDGSEQAVLLLDTNPRAILDDRPLFEVDPLPVRETIWGRLRRMFDDQ